MGQEQQTLQYFRQNAEDWQRKAVNVADEYDLIASRNASVLSTIDAISRQVSLLDIGCGTGQLAIDAARKGHNATGIDFSPEMILQCEQNRKSAGVDAKFDCISFFDFPIVKNAFDVISAQGFIEYISRNDTGIFIARSALLLKKDGALLIGSRNRLFNAVSMNAFTTLENRLNTLDSLVKESTILQSSATQADAIGQLSALNASYVEPTSHPDTGIEVAVRYQYTPAEMIGLLKFHGFETRTIFPIHFHGLPPSAKSSYDNVHHEFAKMMQRIAPTDQRLVPFCSSFVIEARKLQ